jgi:hypothetical protein
MDLKHSLRDRVSAGIDLSLLTSALLPQASAVENDVIWDFDPLFEQVSQELHAEMDLSEGNKQQEISTSSSSQRGVSRRRGQKKP